MFISEWEFISLYWMSISWQANCAQVTMSFNGVLSQSLPTGLKAFLYSLKYVSFPMEDGFVENCFLFSWLLNQILYSVLQSFIECGWKWNMRVTPIFWRLCRFSSKEFRGVKPGLEEGCYLTTFFLSLNCSLHLPASTIITFFLYSIFFISQQPAPSISMSPWVHPLTSY